MNETVFEQMKESAVWPREGEKYGAAFAEGWIDALDWAAGQVEAAGCLCDHLVGRVSAASAKRGERPHDDCCPFAIAAKVREGRS